MTPEQKTLIRSSWSAIPDADRFVTSFYAHLFALDASAARLFAGVDMPAQRQKVAQTFGVVVHALDDLDSIVPAVVALGAKHAQYGVEHRHFDSVGQALVAAFSDTLGSAFTPDVRDAWVNAYGILSSVMQQALGATSAKSTTT
jgi:hemoglobin-like flavoprotein